MSKASNQPLLAVVIPTYNRAPVLAMCLRALAKQTVPAGTFEVFVVDDGSSDDTRSVVENVEGLPFELHYLHQQNAGPSVARNRAIRATGAELVLILNDDTIVVPELVERHLARHAAEPAPEVSVLGRITISPELPHSIFAPLHLDSTFVGFTGKDELGWRGFITCNLSVKRGFLLEHGLFAEGLFPHEDIELGERLSHQGLRVLYEPEALGYHYHALTEDDFFRAAQKDGRALVEWYSRTEAHDELLFGLGLQGPPPLQMRTQQKLSQAVISMVGVGPLAWGARTLARLHEPSARAVYLKLYQQVKRSAIAEAMQSRQPA